MSNIVTHPENPPVTRTPSSGPAWAITATFAMALAGIDGVTVGTLCPLWSVGTYLPAALLAGALIPPRRRAGSYRRLWRLRNAVIVGFTATVLVDCYFLVAYMIDLGRPHA